MRGSVPSRLGAPPARLYSLPMSDLQCLLYMSTASREMAPGEIDGMLQRARARNESLGITGALQASV